METKKFHQNVNASIKVKEWKQEHDLKISKMSHLVFILFRQTADFCQNLPCFESKIAILNTVITSFLKEQVNKV